MAIRTPGEWLGLDGFIWFFGVVEDRDDPLKAGRVRVRCYGWHTDDRNAVPIKTLPWAQVLQQSAAMGDIGKTPLGYVEGTSVLGFFLDGKNAQHPMVIGSFSGIPTELGSVISSRGFSDPNGEYPDRINEPDVNRLARNQDDYQHAVIKDKNDSITKSVSVANGTDTWSEPLSAYNAKYPKNHVLETESGHIKEYDDTLNNERIHEYHKSGTFYEIDKDGNKITRIVGNNYEVIAGNDYLNVKGNCNITVDGTTRLLSTGPVEVQANVNIVGNLSILGDITHTGTQTTTVDVIAGGISLVNHKHGGVTPGGATTGTPV